MMHSQSATAPSLEGQVHLVTGATSGIGRATARALAQRGALVVVCGRDRGKAVETVATLRAETGNPAVDYLLADLSIQAEVRTLAQQVQQRYQRLDVLVNNAGTFQLRRRVSEDGIEMTWAVNMLAPFLLSNLLLDALRASAPARVVNVTSRMHQSVPFDLDDVQLAKEYSGQKAYGASKRALVSFTYELARRLAGSGVTANVLHPGFAATSMGLGDGLLGKVIRPLMRLVADSPAEAARTSVYLAASPEVAGVTGTYFVDCEPADSAPQTCDEEVAARLWDLCAEMTGLKIHPAADKDQP
ncbi:MAG: SDR family oxidoreductase [Anaerolineae bacterium]|jgi:NAD(P)-dependent dehydrogenase (short-subunit alcohol dehydrogenase family)